MEAGEAAEKGIKRVFPDADTVIRPIADGGEGTVDALTEGLSGEKQTVRVTGPLGESVEAVYGIINNDTAVIEMSAAAGITLVSDKDRNPMNTTTYGVGEIIIDAVKKGCRNFIVGIGGSATNDGGIGMLQALGFGMLDEAGEQVPFGAKGLGKIKKITDNGIFSKLSGCSFNIACDVTNPLCGNNGCSAVYGPQKGADKKMIADMDKDLFEYARLTKAIRPEADENTPGAGAAGGIGFAFLAYLGGKLKNGIELILRETDIEKEISDADFVITGEGRLDSQTVMGKVPVGVASLAKKYNKPVIAFSGCVTDEARICNQHGIDAFFPIVRSACSLQEAMDTDHAYKNLADTAEQVMRIIKIKN